MLIYAVIFCSTLFVTYLLSTNPNKELKQFTLPAIINTAIVYFASTRISPIIGGGGIAAAAAAASMTSIPTVAPF